MEKILNHLPLNARVWVFQANKALNPTEAQVVHNKLGSFLSTWQSHGKALKADLEIVLDHFIVVGLDENQAGSSGCSIDGLVHAVKELSAGLHIDFLDNSSIAFLKEDQISIIHFKDIRHAIETGSLTVTSKIFNNSVTRLEELHHHWLVEAGQSWLARFFKKQNA